MYNQIAMIGSNDIVKPLKAIGINVFTADHLSEFETAVTAILKNKNFGVVFLDENIAREHHAIYARLTKDKKITVYLTPTLSGTKGLTKENTKKLIKQAIGFEIT